jgi:hypothetical protein
MKDKIQFFFPNLQTVLFLVTAGAHYVDVFVWGRFMMPLLCRREAICHDSKWIGASKT